MVAEEQVLVPRRWPLWLFRGFISVAALMLFDQAVFAGQFLSGSVGALLTHRNNALAAAVVVAASTVAAVLLRWPGRGPWWPAVACLGLFVLIGAQIGLGFNRVLAVHIPLGVAIIAVAVLLTVWAWRRDATFFPGASRRRGGRAAVAPAATDAGRRR